MTLNRRDFLKSASAVSLAGLGLPACSATSGTAAKAAPKVVVVGGNFAGATCAKYLRVWDPSIDVTLIDPHAHFMSCPMSNWVLAGLRQMEDLVKSYDGLRKHGVKMVQDKVVSVDADKRTVTTEKGATLPYDRLVLATGLEYMTKSVKGYDEAAKEGKVMHAFIAGPETVLLKKQLESMPDGGTFIIASPPPPGKCVSGPYERACMAAHYFKQHKPKSKILMLDGHFQIVSKGEMFQKAFDRFYPGMIEHRPSNLAVGFDAKTMTVVTEFEDHKGDVVNIIPRQRAPELLKKIGVRNDTTDRWCTVDYTSYESTSVPNVHCIGDVVLSNMPKSGHTSNNHGKICAAALIELFAGRQPDPLPVMMNSSYSATSDHTSGPIAVVMRYDPVTKVYVRQPGGGASPDSDEINFQYNLAWFENIWADTLA